MVDKVFSRLAALGRIYWRKVFIVGIWMARHTRDVKIAETDMTVWRELDSQRYIYSM